MTRKWLEGAAGLRQEAMTRSFTKSPGKRADELISGSLVQIKKRPERPSRHKRKQTESLSRGFTLSFTGNANPHDVFQPDSTKQKKVEEESSEKRSPLA
ncbi:MAG: hypothetical protein IJ216_00220 [Acidaminococcaceae bacterium]|nr:hypothetical protein [Acidaminococcaceae bacterium]